MLGGLSETTNLKKSNWIRCVSSSLGYLNYSGRPRLLLIGGSEGSGHPLTATRFHLWRLVGIGEMSIILRGIRQQKYFGAGFI